MKVKTDELTGPALDWVVAKCIGREFELPESFLDYWGDGTVRYSADWALTGPIIEREFIQLADPCTNASYEWRAWCGGWNLCGPTALIAICRTYVASKLGDEAEVPKALFLGGQHENPNSRAYRSRS